MTKTVPKENHLREHLIIMGIGALAGFLFVLFFYLSQQTETLNNLWVNLPTLLNFNIIPFVFLFSLLFLFVLWLFPDEIKHSILWLCIGHLIGVLLSYVPLIYLPLQNPGSTRGAQSFLIWLVPIGLILLGILYLALSIFFGKKITKLRKHTKQRN